MLIYLDTNVFSRPFDDQTRPDIQEEANAFLEIVAEVRSERLKLLCSDILAFEVSNILSAEKHAKVNDYLDLCTESVDTSEAVLNLGRQIQQDCHIRARDALHIASAILGKARYFLSCDKQVIRAKSRECYQRIAKGSERDRFFVMNPALFVEMLVSGEEL